MYFCQNKRDVPTFDMVYIRLPEEKDRRLSFYLAMEEYVARYTSITDAFFMWQVQPSVIFGRNQLIESEVNIDYCRSHGIRMYRRKSGGGCVYADMNNIMFAYITSEDNVGFTFYRYINMVVHVLRLLGVDAKASGRNDIMIGDRKVSGNAFYHLPGRSIVHGTMLYDTDMKNMVGSITPSDAKLVSKGVKSVRQRIALLKDYIDLDQVAFKRFVKEHLCTEEYMLTEQEISTIEEMEKEYLSDAFIYGNNPRYSLVKREWIEGVGELELRMEVRNSSLKSINILGDYFLVGDLNNMLGRLKDVPLDAASLHAALPDKVEDIIRGLQKEDLITLILK